MHETIAQQDRVLIVVALPGHVGDQHILPQGDLAALAGRTIGQHLTGNHRIALADDWTLVEAGVLVGALVLL